MHATNVLAADLARDNDALRARVAVLEARLTAPPMLVIGPHSIDLMTGEVCSDGASVMQLSDTERRLLALLAVAPGSLTRYEWVGEQLWPGTSRRDVVRTIAVNLHRLRGKIDPSPVERYGSGTRSRHFRTVQDYGVALMP